ncbi:MAG: AAA family ATPase [Gammaproteobacteria bacterium]|nr:AAA family ATPase [Gammaproteobacteria bacterium]MDE0364398.1 AAA family ATPase [Gammaproteobacteria bacterium]
MLTRIEADGFKNLVNFSLDFGPYTCIAGANGVGKSNIFDVIRFLSLLADRTINESALQIRSSGEDTGEIADLFFSANGERMSRMSLAAEMIVDKEVVDDFGRPGESSSTFLRYEVAFRHEQPSSTVGPLGGLVLERENLTYFPSGKAAQHLKFPHSKQTFRSSVVFNKRRGMGYISTRSEGENELATIVIHQDGGSSGRARPAAPAASAPRTIIGTENTAVTPTILAARREMQRWRILALEPSAMRRPDKFTDAPGITADGGHIPATLHHLAAHASGGGNDVLSRIVSRLSSLVPVKSVQAVSDDVRQLFSLELEERFGVRLKANSISDGTLRFLALAAIADATDTGGVYCMEEPENGIHPGKLNAMNRLLHDIAVDPDEAVENDNPLRQVIVVTHSPYFVQVQKEDELILAKNTMTRSSNGSTISPLKCYPMQGSWRDRASRQGNGGPRGVGKLDLQSYLVPPENGQLLLPLEPPR